MRDVVGTQTMDFLGQAPDAPEKTGVGSHHSARSQTVEWLTPPNILSQLGEFDLDPCAPVKRPWDTAKVHYTIEDDGLSRSWGDGRVWLNPPYGAALSKWMARMAGHKNGIALIFARTEVVAWQDFVWPHASAILFLKGRLHFYRVDGTCAITNAGAPSVLIAYSDADAKVLRGSEISGHFVPLTVGGRRVCQSIG